MRFDDAIDFPEGDFIPGIYNYCNRWCERCMYTDKCRTFAMEKVMVREMEAEKKRKKSMEENKDFWDQVNRTVEDAAGLIDEEFPLEKNDAWDVADDWDDEEAKEAMKELEAKREKAKDQNVSKVALKYEKAVHQWFNDRKEILKQEYEPEINDFKVSYPGISDEAELKKLAEAVEVVQWYHIQIWIKTNRALSSLYEEEDEGDYFEGLPKDSDGTAMVVINGITSSIGAWNYLHQNLPAETDSIRPILRMLLWMKMEMEKIFPDAMDFVWPPKG